MVNGKWQMAEIHDLPLAISHLPFDICQRKNLQHQATESQRRLLIKRIFGVFVPWCFIFLPLATSHLPFDICQRKNLQHQVTESQRRLLIRRLLGVFAPWCFILPPLATRPGLTRPSTSEKPSTPSHQVTKKARDKKNFGCLRALVFHLPASCHLPFAL